MSTALNEDALYDVGTTASLQAGPTPQDAADRDDKRRIVVNAGTNAGAMRRA